MSEKKEVATRIISGKLDADDVSLDTNLRPRRLNDFIGQEKVKSNLEIVIAAAKKRGEPLDHIILYGPPGLGKTTLAYVIAAEMGVKGAPRNIRGVRNVGERGAINAKLGE